MSEVVRAVVTAWHPHRSKRVGDGFARVLLPDGNGDISKPSLYISEENITTFGVETLRPGKVIECEIGPRSEGYDSHVAYNIAIFMD